MSFSQTLLMGNVGGDPDIRVMTNGDKVASFSLATSERWKDKTTGEAKEKTEWHRVVVFNQSLVKLLEAYVKKGHKLLVQGQNQTRQYEKDGVTHKITEVVLNTFNSQIRLEGTPQGHTRSPDDYGTTTTRPSDPVKQTFARDFDDEVPFAPEFR
jgi:single-strand DNA-binding protein